MAGTSFETYAIKNLWILSLIILASCGGSLSDEQRKKLREGMSSQKIIKVSESEIMASGLKEGQKLFERMKLADFDSAKVDAIEKASKTSIRWIVPGASTAHEIENQLIEAYVLGMATGALQDNVQKIRKRAQRDEYDSVLYSKPIVTKMADGTDKLEGVWNIYISKKNIILALGESM